MSDTSTEEQPKAATDLATDLATKKPVVVAENMDSNISTDNTENINTPRSYDVSARSDDGSDEEFAHEYKDAVESRTIEDANIHCKSVVIGPNGFQSIGSILAIIDKTQKIAIFNKDKSGNANDTPYDLKTLKEQLNITVDASKTGKGGSKRSRKAKRTKKGGKKRRNTQRRHRKSR